MGLKRKRFRCGWRTLGVLAVCMVEIGRVRVKAGNAPVKQKISAYPPQADICAFVSTSLAPGHHGPDHSRDFVGERDRRNLGRSPRQQGRKPGPMFGAMDLGVTDDRK